MEGKFTLRDRWNVARMLPRLDLDANRLLRRNYVNGLFLLITGLSQLSAIPAYAQGQNPDVPPIAGQAGADPGPELGGAPEIDVIQTAWEGVPVVGNEKKLNGNLDLSDVYVVKDGVNQRTEPSSQQGNATVIQTLDPGAIFESDPTEMGMNDLDPSSERKWNKALVVHDGKTSLDKGVEGYIADGFFEPATEVPPELEARYQTPAELSQPTLSLDIAVAQTPLDAIGGTDEQNDALAALWGVENVSQLTALQRYASTAVTQFDFLNQTENLDSRDIDLGEAFPQIGKAKIHVRALPSGHREAILQILHPEETAVPRRMFFIVRIPPIGLTEQPAQAAVATQEAFVAGLGAEKAEEIAQSTVLVSGDGVLEEVAKTANAVYLAGNPEGQQFAPIIDDENVLYTREENSSYSARTIESTFHYANGEWIEAPDWSKFGAPLELYANAFSLDTDEVLNTLNINQYTNTKGQPYLVAEHNGNPLLIATVNPTTNEPTWVLASPLTLEDATGVEISTGVVGSYLANWHEESKIMQKVVEPFSGIGLTYDFQMHNPDYDDLTMRPDEDTFNFKHADDSVRLAESLFRNRPIHAQNALEFVRTFIPPWLKDMYDANAVRQIAIDHVSTLIKKYKGRIDSWTVFGEMYNQWTPNVWVEKLGTSDISWIKDVYDAAREADPDAQLIYSDFDIEFGGDKADRTYETLKRVVESGAPVDAIAFQMHINGKDFMGDQLDLKIGQLRTQIKRYQELGLEVIIGEMDVMMEGVSPDSFTRSQAQATIVRALLKAIVEEKVTDIRFFSQIDRLSWKEQQAFAGGPNGDPTLFDDQGNPKPSYYAAMSALLTH